MAVSGLEKIMRLQVVFVCGLVTNSVLASSPVLKVNKDTNSYTQQGQKVFMLCFFFNATFLCR